MEVDEIQRQVSKYQRVSSNGSTTTTENSSNPQKIATRKGNFEVQNHVDDSGGGGGGRDVDMVVGGGGGVARLCGWPSSRIVRVSRASGGKDRHSKVLTSKGLRDRRVRLSVGTAIQFYDLQDRLGYDQPSKAVEWLLKAASSSIDELPSLDLPVVGAIPDHQYHHHHHHHQMANQKKIKENHGNGEHEGKNNVTQAIRAKSPVCSSTSETSKGSELSLSRSENRIKARERAREMASSKKEKEKDMDSTTVNVLNHQVNNISDNSSFTDLLTGGINTTTATPAFFNRHQQPPPQLFQLPQFNITTGDNIHYSFLQDNINFSMASPSPSSTGGGAPGGFTRGTLQSNLPAASILPHHHHLQRFQQSSMDGSTSANFPFFIVPNGAVDHFQSTGGYHIGYGGGGGDHQKDKAKN